MENRKRRHRRRNTGTLVILFFAAVTLLGVINLIRLCISGLSMETYAGADGKIEGESRGMETGTGNKGKKNKKNKNPFKNDGRDMEAGDEGLLTLVNKWNPISRDYQINLVQLKGGHSVDERCYPYLQQMLDDCRSAGLSPLICSSYRAWEKQEDLYMKRVRELIWEGYGEKEAMELAATSNAVPGTSEHQLGLAVDIVDSSYQLLDEKQETTPVQKWLMNNCYKYGFILRYPNGKSELTGIIYEPWHYRFVGMEAAKEIHEQGICLEEYLSGG